MQNGDEKGRKARYSWRHLGLAAFLVLAAGIAWFAFQQRRTSEAETPPLVRFVPASDALGLSVGSPDAPVVLREFADFECPACGGFEPVLGYMRKQYVDAGKVRFVFFDYPLTDLHPHALLAAQAARCAGIQGGYWAMHDLLYARQRDWAHAEDPKFDPMPEFEAYAGELKLDAAALSQCIKHGDTLAAIRKSIAYGDSLGINATPSYGVNGVGRAGGMEYPDLRALIEAQLKNPTPPTK